MLYYGLLNNYDVPVSFDVPGFYLVVNCAKIFTHQVMIFPLFLL